MQPRNGDDMRPCRAKGMGSLPRRSLLVGALAATFALASCTARAPMAALGDGISPSAAVQLAAAVPERGVEGRFPMTVRAAGRTRVLHLNSEEDYRDQRNLSIAVSPAAEAALAARLGKPPIEAMVGRDIVVTGRARRVRIELFLDDGTPTDKYYYQTHVVVTDADRIALR